MSNIRHSYKFTYLSDIFSYNHLYENDIRINDYLIVPFTPAPIKFQTYRIKIKIISFKQFLLSYFFNEKKKVYNCEIDKKRKINNISLPN